MPSFQHRDLREGWGLSVWCVIAAFGTYFCMYAFRKPFTAATYSDFTLWGIGYKTILVTAQVMGYTLSKFLGIKIVAEMPPSHRAVGILILIALAQAALLLFGLVPPPYNGVFLFLNGLPLGMVFGLVLGFLEGRRHTEALAAGLCCSFILADGVTKSVGAHLLEAGQSPFWMPFQSGLIFTPALLLFVWMLARIPPPSSADIAARSERTPMNGEERRRFFRRYAVGLTLLVLVYLLVTVMRSIRADFAPEIWTGLGTTGQPNVFARSELVVALGVVLLNGLTVFIRDNRRAFFLSMLVSVVGILLLGVALAIHAVGGLEAFPFMVLLGLGLYLPYVAVHTTVFERLIALTRDRGNIGYLMYLADAFGYLGYVAVMLARNFIGASGNFLDFFLAASWTIAVGAFVTLVLCWWSFATHPATARTG